MLSKISWLEYGTFILVSLLVYYAVILLLYYRQEIKSMLLGVAGKMGNPEHGDTAAPIEIADGGLMGKIAPEEGVSSVDMDELDFGGDEHATNAGMMQGDLADCMEEVDFTIGLAGQKGWDSAKLLKSIGEIAESYRDVFASSLRGDLLAHISWEITDKLGFEISVSELSAKFGGCVSGKPGSGLSGKVIAVGAALIAFFFQVAQAQDGNQGISEATNKVAGYFDTGTDLMYAIGAIMGLVGAVKVYSKWNAGEPDTAKVATAWFGSCIFLVVVATVLKSFFGI